MQPAKVNASTERPQLAPWGRWARRCRWVLVAGWLVLVVVTLLVGERESSLSALEDAVSSGEVRDVEVSRGLAAEGRGFATVHVRWDRGPITYAVDVIEARPLRAAPSRGQRGEDVRVVEDLETYLLDLQPDLEIVPFEWRGPASTVLGWGLPGWTGLLHGLVVLATLVSLTSSPQPWRATRWGWFWLLALVPPLGVPAYLLLAGPTPPVPAPRRPDRRLSGGSSFALALVAGVLGSVVVAVLPR